MRAIVCDKCGKVNLLGEDERYGRACGVYRLLGDMDESVIDLCENCKNELLGAVRRTKGGGDDG